MVDLDELERFFKERVEVHQDPKDPYDDLPQDIKDYRNALAVSMIFLPVKTDLIYYYLYLKCNEGSI